jgi:hypothetical protein
MRVLATLLVIAVTVPLLTQEVAPLPRERPDGVSPVPAASEVALPRRRPEPAILEPIAEVPPPAPPRIYQAACPAVLAGRVEAEMLPPLADGACGVRSPLSVTAILVNGRMVPLSSPAIVNCRMATALPEWAAAVDGYLAAREGTRLARLLTGTSYFCRNRNNAATGDLSEHGFANALDVTGFELEDGRTISLPDGWLDPLSPAGRLLRFAHDAACAGFTTTLGPGANALHADHLHVDLGCHGAACRARLCE